MYVCLYFAIDGIVWEYFLFIEFLSVRYLSCLVTCVFTALDLIPHWSFVIDAHTDHLSLITTMALLSCNMRLSWYRLDAETRRNAVNALTEIGLRLLLSYSHATTTAKTSPKPDDVFVPSALIKRVFFGILQRSCEDYSIDKRGDIGSWIRAAALRGLVQPTWASLRVPHAGDGFGAWPQDSRCTKYMRYGIEHPVTSSTLPIEDSTSTMASGSASESDRKAVAECSHCLHARAGMWRRVWGWGWHERSGTGPWECGGGGLPSGEHRCDCSVRALGGLFVGEERARGGVVPGAS